MTPDQPSATDERARHVATLRLMAYTIPYPHAAATLDEIATWIERAGEDEARAAYLEACCDCGHCSSVENTSRWHRSRTYARLHPKPDEATP